LKFPDLFSSVEHAEGKFKGLFAAVLARSKEAEVIQV
jgi:hypothetical protein